MSSSQPPPGDFQSDRPTSHGSSWPSPPDGPGPCRVGGPTSSRVDSGSQANPHAAPAAPPAAQTPGFRTAHGYGPVHDYAHGYGPVHDYAGGRGAGYGYGTNYGMPVRVGRNGAEKTHLIGLCFALAFFALIKLVFYVRIQAYISDGSAAIILMQNVLLSPFVWLMVGAIIQAVRRRPTVLTVAALVVTGLNAAAQLALWGNFSDSAFNLILFLVVGSLGSHPPGPTGTSTIVPFR